MFAFAYGAFASSFLSRAVMATSDAGSSCVCTHPASKTPASSNATPRTAIPAPVTLSARPTIGSFESLSPNQVTKRTPQFQGDNGPNSIVVGTCCRNAAVWTRAVESCLSRDPESVPGRTAEPNVQCLNFRFTMLEAPWGLQPNKRPAGPLDIELHGHRQQ